MADRDILFAVRNNFYIGAYNNAINEASDMEGLSEAEQTERDVYVYRSYIALGSHDVSWALQEAYCFGTGFRNILKQHFCTFKDCVHSAAGSWWHGVNKHCAQQQPCRKG